MNTPPTGLDWRSPAHWGGGRLLPCRHCGQLAFLRDQHSVPCHKTCAEQAADQVTTEDYREELTA